MRIQSFEERVNELKEFIKRDSDIAYTSAMGLLLELGAVSPFLNRDKPISELVAKIDEELARILKRTKCTDGTFSLMLSYRSNPRTQAAARILAKELIRRFNIEARACESTESLIEKVTQVYDPEGNKTRLLKLQI
jgi:hypothetical protein